MSRSKEPFFLPSLMGNDRCAFWKFSLVRRYDQKWSSNAGHLRKECEVMNAGMWKCGTMPPWMKLSVVSSRRYSTSVSSGIRPISLSIALSMSTMLLYTVVQICSAGNGSARVYELCIEHGCAPGRGPSSR